MDPKLQENDRQNPCFLQIPLLQITRNTSYTKALRVLHRELSGKEKMGRGWIALPEIDTYKNVYGGLLKFDPDL